MANKMSVRECFDVLHIPEAKQKHFKDTLIEAIETFQTYPRKLVEIPPNVVVDFAFDFFLHKDENLARWWPEWSPAVQASFVSDPGRLELAIVALFEHWISNKKKTHNRNDIYTMLKNPPSKSNGPRSPVKKSANGRRKNNVVNNSITAITTATTASSATGAATNQPRIPVSPTRSASSVVAGPSRDTRLDYTVQGRQLSGSNSRRPPVSLKVPTVATVAATDSTNPRPSSIMTDFDTLPDIQYREDELTDSSDAIPSPSAIIHNKARPAHRNSSCTIEPQSPRPGGKGKEVVRRRHETEDSTYVDSQPSTLGQPPISPPPTRIAHKRKQDYDIREEFTSEEPVMSPLAKKSRQRRHMMEIEQSVGADRRSTEDIEEGFLHHSLEDQNRHSRGAINHNGQNGKTPNDDHGDQSFSSVGGDDDDDNSNDNNDDDDHNDCNYENENGNENENYDDASYRPDTMITEESPVREIEEIPASREAQEPQEGSTVSNDNNDDNNRANIYNDEAFDDLSEALSQYLNHCKEISLQRANDPRISQREAERLHIRSAILEHLHCDITSRIKAVDAKRKGLKVVDISSYTLYS